MALKDNADLFRYLNDLWSDLEARGRSDIAREVNCVMQFGIGSSSEFLHEAGTLLRTLQTRCRGILTEEQLREMRDVIGQIEAAFGRIGGA